jgi:putative ABC transport system ATP-binding protein
VLRGIDLDVAEGEFVSIVGASGSGKTTLLNIIGGLDRGAEGTIRVAGKPIPELNDRAVSDLRSGTVGFVFQAYHLLDHLTVAENVALPSLFSRSSDAMAESGLERRIAEVLEVVGLSERGDDRPAKLSGGERQRVAIARALLLRPAVLLCDEPTGNLDEETGASVVDLFKKIHEGGVTILVVTHDQKVFRTAERSLRLKDGTLEAWQPEGVTA